MVALNDNLTQGQECGFGSQATSERFVSLCLGGETDSLPAGRCSPASRGKLLIIDRTADAYGNTIIMTANRGSDSATQSAYGANGIIFCGYPDRGIATAVIGTGPYDPETELYYVRNRMYNPALGRWIQRDPIGYSGGINLYGYVGGRSVVALDPSGRVTLMEAQATLKYLGILSKRAKKGSEELEHINEAITVVKALRGSQAAREDVLNDALAKLRDAAWKSINAAGGAAGALATQELNADIAEIRIGVLIAASLAVATNKVNGCKQCAQWEPSSQPGITHWSSHLQESIYAGGFVNASNYLGANFFWYSALITWTVPCKKDKYCNVYAMIAVPTGTGLSWVWVPCNTAG